MKKIISVLCVLTLVFTGAQLPASAAEVSARAAILMDAATGAVLYEKNSREILPMASTTKAMTALLTLEYIDSMCDEIVTVTKEMVAVEGSSMGLRQGDRISLSALVVGMLLPSGNDAANAAALHISKSLPGFAESMNRKAGELGMKNTHFVTPSGLDDPQHYTTAYDMALLMAAAMKNAEFARISGSKQLTVRYNRGETQASFTNHNKLLRLYADCAGGKTGFTKKSGRCLVSAATRSGATLICVTLNAGDDWNDHMSLFELGFDGMKTAAFEEAVYKIPDTAGRVLKVRVRAGEMGYLSGEKAERRIFLPRFLYAGSLKKGDIIGKIVYMIDGVVLTQAPVAV